MLSLRVIVCFLRIAALGRASAALRICLGIDRKRRQAFIVSLRFQRFPSPRSSALERNGEDAVESALIKAMLIQNMHHGQSYPVELRYETQNNRSLALTVPSARSVKTGSSAEAESNRYFLKKSKVPPGCFKVFPGIPYKAHARCRGEVILGCVCNI
jgi:hypothetical protein